MSGAPAGRAESKECLRAVAQVHASMEHGRDESMAEHMRVGAGDSHPSSVSQAAQAAGGGVPVHPRATAVEQDRAGIAGAMARSMARPTAGGSGTRTALVP